MAAPFLVMVRLDRTIWSSYQKHRRIPGFWQRPRSLPTRQSYPGPEDGPDRQSRTMTVLENVLLHPALILMLMRTRQGR